MTFIKKMVNYAEIKDVNLMHTGGKSTLMRLVHKKISPLPAPILKYRNERCKQRLNLLTNQYRDV